MQPVVASKKDSKYTKALLELQIRRSYHTVYTKQRCYEKSAEKNLNIDNWIKGIQIVTVAFTTGAFAAVFFSESVKTTIFGVEAIKIGAILSAINLIATTGDKTFNFATIAIKNKQTAHRLWKIKEAYTTLLTEFDDNHDINDLRTRRDELSGKTLGIYSSSFSTTIRDYNKAKKYIKDRVEQHTFFNENEERINELEVFLNSEKK